MNGKKLIKRRLLQLTILLFIPLMITAQQDSADIRNKILNFKESDQLFIQRTRDFVLSSLKQGKADEASEAFTYVLQKYNGTYFRPFWLAEKIELAFWFGEYSLIYKADSIDYDIEKTGGEYENQEKYLYPQRDEFQLELTTLTDDNRTVLIKRIDSLVTGEEHDYLVLFFDWFTHGAPLEGYTPEEEEEYLEKDLTPRAEEFLARYSDSRFRPFVLKHFRYVYELGSTGFGYYVGLGSLVPLSTAEHYLNPEGSFGAGINFSWSELIFDFGVDIGIPEKVKTPFYYDGKMWTQDIAHNYYTYFLTTGFIIQESRSFKIFPQIGIGALNMNVCEEDKDKAGGEFSMTSSALQLGLNCDIKIDIYSIFTQRNIQSYSGIRLGFDYYRFLGNNPIMSGGMFRFRVSIVDFVRPFIRDI